MGCCHSHTRDGSAQETAIETVSGPRSTPEGAPSGIPSAGEFNSIGWDEEDDASGDDADEQEYASLYNDRNSMAERMAADATARAEKSARRAKKRAETKAIAGQTAEESTTNPSCCSTEESDRDERSPAARDRSDRWSGPENIASAAPKTASFLSRQSISAVVNENGFAKAAEIARERRLQKKSSTPELSKTTDAPGTS